MEKEIINKKLTITLNDDMCKFAIEKGYKMPCVSINHYYGKKAIFQINFENNQPKNYELTILDEKGKEQAIYLM